MKGDLVVWYDHVGGERTTKAWCQRAHPPPPEEDGVVCLFENSHGIAVKKDTASLSQSLPTPKSMYLKVGMMLTLCTGSIDKR